MSRPATAIFLLVLVGSWLPGCVQDARLPDLGACSESPEGGNFEYGQVGVGDCLASPADLRVRPDPTDPDNHFLVVVNSNSRGNFQGSSLLSIDASSIDVTCPVNGMHELTTAALGVEDFAGRVAFADDGLALLGQRQTGGEDGVLTDIVFTIDASDPRALSWSPAGPNAWGPHRYITVPSDPWTIEINPWDGRAWVLSLTHHLVNALDLVSDPIEFVDLHGDRSVGSARFVDADGSGSSPDFRLVGINETRLRNETLSITYFGGTVRLYVPVLPEDGGPRALRPAAGHLGSLMARCLRRLQLGRHRSRRCDVPLFH